MVGSGTEETVGVSTGASISKLVRSELPDVVTTVPEAKRIPRREGKPDVVVG